MTSTGHMLRNSKFYRMTTYVSHVSSVYVCGHRTVEPVCFAMAAHHGVAIYLLLLVSGLMIVGNNRFGL